MPETGLHVRTSLSKYSGIRIKDLFEENIEKLTIFDSPPFLPQHHQIQMCQPKLQHFHEKEESQGPILSGCKELNADLSLNT